MAAVTAATYIQRGESLDYINNGDTALEGGTVVALETRIGVIGGNTAPGAVGSVHVMGVFEIKKAAGKEVKQGAALYYDADAGEITDDASKIPAGYAATASKSEAETVLVNIGFPPAAGGAGAGGDIDSKLEAYQKKITVSGILKGEGGGTVVAASAGVDYASPGGA